MFTCRSVVRPVRNVLMAGTFFSGPLAHAQTSAVVHQFNFTVAEELTTELSVNDRSRAVLPGYSVSTALPEALVDSIAVAAERALTEKLGMPVRMCWTKGKKGTDRGSFLGPLLIGLPNNTFKLAKEYFPGEARFIELNCRIDSGGSVSIGDASKSKLKPMVTMTLQVLDGGKNERMEKKAKVKDLGTLRSSTEYRGPVETTRSETLGPYDIYGIYRMALAELMRQ